MKRLITNPYVILTLNPSLSGILSVAKNLVALRASSVKGKNLETLPLHFVQGQGDS